MAKPKGGKKQDKGPNGNKLIRTVTNRDKRIAKDAKRKAAAVGKREAMKVGRGTKRTVRRREEQEKKALEEMKSETGTTPTPV